MHHAFSATTRADTDGSGEAEGGQMLEVQVGYKQVDASDWHLVRLDPTDYFWRDPDQPGADFEVDSEPEHNHVAELLPPDVIDRLQYAFTRVIDAINGSSYECAYHFWGGLNDYVCLVTCQQQAATGKELIFSGRMPFKQAGSQVIRVVLDEPMPQLTMNSFMWGPGGAAESLDMLSGRLSPPR
jgi:hypothetical protein